MKRLEKILEKEKMIWIEVERKNTKEFLSFAKLNNFKWLNGKIINTDKDKPFFHLSLSSDKTLANVAMFAWLSPSSTNIKKISFDEFKKMI
jgi:hypothetical protein